MAGDPVGSVWVNTRSSWHSTTTGFVVLTQKMVGERWGGKQQKKKPLRHRGRKGLIFAWCSGTELNRRHGGFQWDIIDFTHNHVLSLLISNR